MNKRIGPDMIVIREKPFMSALDAMIAAIQSTATDGNGLKIVMEIDRDKFGAAILRAIPGCGVSEFEPPPYLLADGKRVEDIPSNAFHPGDLTKLFVANFPK
jgi:hypothetical protein